jgi:hypothetical protein
MTTQSKTISQGKFNETYRLYDESIWLVGIGLIYLTWSAFDGVLSSEHKLYSIPGLLLAWVFVLLKVDKIHIEDSRTIIFRSLFRSIVLNPQDITAYQEWVRGARVVYKGGSIILWPYIEKQGQFKGTLQAINPNIVFVDISKEGTKTNIRVAVIVLGIFAYFGLLIWSLFHGITQSFK